MLEGLYRMVGDTTNAATAASHVAILKGLAPEVVTAREQLQKPEPDWHY